MSRATFKLALKVLARRKVFTAISLVGIALTLVVLVVAAAVFDSALSAQKPQSRLDRILLVSRLRQKGPHATEITNPGRRLLDATLRDFPGAERVSYAGDVETAVLYHGNSRLEVPMRRTDADYWRIFDFAFLEGAPFTGGDLDANRNVAVITSELRHTLFGDAPAVGRTIDLGGDVYRIVGVVPRPSITQLVAYSDVWVPFRPPTADERASMTGRLFGVVLRAPNADAGAMKREFATRVARVPLSDPKTFRHHEAELRSTFESFADNLVPDRLSHNAAQTFVIGSLLLALLFMTLPTLNLVTLNLSRILERASEVGVRKAFGAPRRALVGQFVAENVVLTIVGGAIALPLSAIVLAAIDRLDLVPGLRFSLNLHVFFAALLIAIFFGVFSGAYPAWRMARLDPVQALRGGAA